MKKLIFIGAILATTFIAELMVSWQLALLDLIGTYVAYIMLKDTIHEYISWIKNNG